MKIIRDTVLLAGLIFSAVSVGALQPATISLAWDYNLGANNGVTGFQIFTLLNDGTHGALVANVPLPSPLPVPDATGSAVFTADVIPDRTGRREFVAVVVTADLAVFSIDSNIHVQIVRPDRAGNLR